MEKDLFQDIKQSIEAFQEALKGHLPVLEAEIKDLIKTGNKDKNTIENILDTMLLLVDMGVGEELFLQLLEHYKQPCKMEGRYILCSMKKGLGTSKHNSSSF